MNYGEMGVPWTRITEHKHYLQAGGITFAMHTMRVKTAGGTIAAPALPTGTAAYTSSYLQDNELVRYPGIETSDIVTPSNRVPTL